MKSKLKLLLVAGARPNFMKIAPLADELRRPENAARAEFRLVHTGQHYDDALSRVFFDQLGIPRPDVNLEVGSQSHAQQTAEIMARFEPVCLEWRPDIVVVVGDVNSTIACALVAAKLGIRVAHVEAGLRSFDRTMPEEVNRILTDAISDFLFVTEPAGVENLRREGVAPEKIHLVGNVMIDSLRKHLPVARQSNALREFGFLPPAAREVAQASAAGGPAPSESNSAQPVPNIREAALQAPLPYALLTLHRPSNVDEPEKLAALFTVLEELAREIPILFPVHPRTRERMERAGLLARACTKWTHEELITRHSPLATCILLCPPIGYLEFLHLMSQATLVLTDSGGIQEETTVLGVPCLTLRDNTERPITCSAGTNQLVGTDPARVLAAARAALAAIRASAAASSQSAASQASPPESGVSRSFGTPHSKAAPQIPLWDGAAAARIVKILLG